MKENCCGGGEDPKKIDVDLDGNKRHLYFNRHRALWQIPEKQLIGHKLGLLHDPIT
jgi:hypothetical protein